MQGLRRTSSGRFEMLMDRYRKPVKADVIVLAQPLPALREADLSGRARSPPRTGA